MSKEKRRVPKLRFPGFTEDWEQRKLSEFVDKAVDNRGKTPPLDENGAHPLIEVAALGGVYPDYSKVEKYLSDDVFNTNLRAYIKKDDILFTTVGSIGLVSLMDSREEAAIAQNIVAFRAKENFLPEYLYALFSNEDNQYKAKRIAMVAVQPSIKVSQLVNVEYMISTNIEEQERIGVFFSSLQSLITLHQRKLDNLKLKKKALLQKLFPKNGERYPELRFPGFTDAWEQRKFGEIYERAGQKNDLTYGIDKIISVANMYFKKDVTVGSEEYLKTYNVFKLGDIAFEGHTNKEYRYGRFVENTIGDGIVSHIFDVFTPKINLDINFWKDLIKYEPIMGPILRRCTKASRMMSNLTTKEFLEEQILCPTLEEQKLIGEFIVSLDKNITLHQRKLDHLQLQKKALLQQMFV